MKEETIFLFIIFGLLFVGFIIVGRHVNNKSSTCVSGYNSVASTYGYDIPRNINFSNPEFVEVS
jgi:hypothetical protein